jgi:hypothetical protein
MTHSQMQGNWLVVQSLHQRQRLPVLRQVLLVLPRLRQELLLGLLVLLLLLLLSLVFLLPEQAFLLHPLLLFPAPYPFRRVLVHLLRRG